MESIVLNFNDRINVQQQKVRKNLKFGGQIIIIYHILDSLMQTISQSSPKSKFVSTSHPSPSLLTPFSPFAKNNTSDKKNAAKYSLKENQPSAYQQVKLKVKSEGQATSYQDKRSFIFGWLRKYSAKLKLSQQAAAMTQILSDRLYSVVFYDSKQAKTSLVTILGICSKFWDRKIVFPEQLSYIFTIDLSKLEQRQEFILCSVDFNLNFPNYAHELNAYLNSQQKNYHLSFFNEDVTSYRLLCLTHSIVQSIYEEKRSVNEKDMLLTVKTVLEGKKSVEWGEMEEDCSLGRESMEQKLEKVNRRYNKNSGILEQVLKEKKGKWGQIVIRYVFFQ